MHAAGSVNAWSARQQYSLSMLVEFLTGVHYLLGAHNVAANPLSRSPVASVSLGINLSDLSLSQKSCPSVHISRTAITGLTLHDFSISPDGPVILCDVFTCIPRPLVPLDARRRVFDLPHELLHLGIRTSQQLIGEGVCVACAGTLPSVLVPAMPAKLTKSTATTIPP